MAISPGGRPADASPVGTPGGRQNWVDKTGGLPRYVRMVAHALIRQGHPKSQAIQMAIGVLKNWASGKGNVSPKVRAAAAAAIAQWEAMKAKSHSLSGGTGNIALSRGTLPGTASEVGVTRFVVDPLGGRAAPVDTIDLAGHWKHGWIPLDAVAALSKAKGNRARAAKYSTGRTSSRSAANHTFNATHAAETHEKLASEMRARGNERMAKVYESVARDARARAAKYSTGRAPMVPKRGGKRVATTTTTRRGILGLTSEERTKIAALALQVKQARSRGDNKSAARDADKIKRILNQSRSGARFPRATGIVHRRELGTAQSRFSAGPRSSYPSSLHGYDLGGGYKLQEIAPGTLALKHPNGQRIGFWRSTDTSATSADRILTQAREAAVRWQAASPRSSHPGESRGSAVYSRATDLGSGFSLRSNADHTKRALIHNGKVIETYPGSMTTEAVMAKARVDKETHVRRGFPGTGGHTSEQIAAARAAMSKRSGKSSIEGKDFRSMTPAEKKLAGEIMHGTGGPGLARVNHPGTRAFGDDTPRKIAARYQTFSTPVLQRMLSGSGGSPQTKAIIRAILKKRKAV